MTENFEQTYFDVLRAIELAIFNADQQAALVDTNVDKALDGLTRLYTAETRGRNAPKLRFSQDEHTLADHIKAACDLHLGRDTQVMIGEDQKTVDEIIACLKRIRRSLGQMSKKGGKRAYLDFLRQFFGDN